MKTDKNSYPLTDAPFWKQQWEGVNIKTWADYSTSFTPAWHDFLWKELLPYKGGSCLEIGCFPGRYLNYFSKEFGMQTEGIDFMPPSDSLHHKIHSVDFLQFISDRKYDVVCSFGFIEHFQSPEDIIRRHWALVEDSGLMLITVPNFVHGWRYFPRRIWDRRMFVNHNREVMVIGALTDIIGKIDAQFSLVSPLAFSKRNFDQSKGFKSHILRAWSKIIRNFPTLDLKFATEIVLLLKKRER